MPAIHFPIRLSTLREEGLLQVSKWIKTQVFLNADEMKELIHAMEPLFLVNVSEPVKAEEVLISSQTFIEKYAEYVFYLEQAKVPPIEEFRRFFSCAIASNLEVFYGLPVGDEKCLIRPNRPVLQLQAHHFFFSALDQKFHPMVFGQDSISWGLQFSYPQLYQDPKTRQIIKVTNTEEFPNTALFSKLMKWMRSSTLPTPFEFQGMRVNSPIRIGKKSLAWIKNHPQLKRKGIQIAKLEIS